MKSSFEWKICMFLRWWYCTPHWCYPLEWLWTIRGPISSSQDTQVWHIVQHLPPPHHPPPTSWRETSLVWRLDCIHPLFAAVLKSSSHAASSLHPCQGWELYLSPPDAPCAGLQPLQHPRCNILVEFQRNLLLQWLRRCQSIVNQRCHLPALLQLLQSWKCQRTRTLPSQDSCHCWEPQCHQSWGVRCPSRRHLPQRPSHTKPCLGSLLICQFQRGKTGLKSD